VLGRKSGPRGTGSGAGGVGVWAVEGAVMAALAPW
jgi:hypothetical protein